MLGGSGGVVSTPDVNSVISLSGLSTWSESSRHRFEGAPSHPWRETELVRSRCVGGLAPCGVAVRGPLDFIEADVGRLGSCDFCAILGPGPFGSCGHMISDVIDAEWEPGDGERLVDGDLPRESSL